MTTKKTIKSAVSKTSDSAAKVAGKEGEGDEARVVADRPVGGGSHAPRVQSKEAADAENAAIPNVQAEANHASNAPEDVRDAQVAPPNT